MDLLRQRLDDPDGEVHREVLLSLFLLGYTAEGPDREAVQALISQECGRAAWVLMAQEDLNAAVDAALSLIGSGALGGRQLGIVLAAALAVGLEFGLLRAGDPLWQGSRGRGRSRPLTT